MKCKVCDGDGFITSERLMEEFLPMKIRYVKVIKCPACRKLSLAAFKAMLKSMLKGGSDGQ